MFSQGSILVNPSGAASLWDFGCSQIEFTQGHQPPLSPYHRPFIAPELLDVELPFATRQSDIYSLAAVVWFLGRSQPSWGFPDGARGARAMVHQMRPPLPFDIPGGLTNDDTRPLWDVIRSMLSDDPRLRPTISDVRNELMRSGLVPRPPQPTAICLPRHLCSSHSEYFKSVSPASMRSIRAALDDRHFFRSALLDLPPTELGPVVEGLQAVCRIPDEETRCVLVFEINLCTCLSALLSASIAALFLGMSKARD